VTAVVGVGLAYYYFFNKGQLENLQLLKEEKNYEECVNKAKTVPQLSPFYTDVQNLLNECQRLLTDEKLLAQSKELASNNNFKDAIFNASKIQQNSKFYSLAQHLIDEWSWNLVKQAEERYKQSYNYTDLENAIDITKAIPKTSSVAKSAEEMSDKWRTEWNNNETYLNAAKNALRQGKWQEAINTTNKVKQDTPYWQNKMKLIIEIAQKAIADSDNPVEPELPLPHNPPAQPFHPQFHTYRYHQFRRNQNLDHQRANSHPNQLREKKN